MMLKLLKNAAGLTGLALLLLFAACHTAKTPVANAGSGGDITEKYWKLLTVDGRRVTMAPGQQREAHVILKKADNALSGNGGCNGFGGNYELLPQGRIRFFDIISTMMACEGTNDENSFFAALRAADRYTQRGDTLMLYKGQQAVATLAAVYLR